MGTLVEQSKQGHPSLQEEKGVLQGRNMALLLSGWLVTRFTEI